jgi:Phytanoyl-CoA dioxygenase (PhyH)
MNIYVDSDVNDETRRAAVYDGSIFTYSPTPISLEFCRFAQELIEEAFNSLDPLRAHESLPAERCAEILADLKPKFIHHPKSKQCIQNMLAELGCDLDETYFDVPRMRTAFPGDYLKSGIAYAFHPHRDTWYSAPHCQINWWMPIYDVTPKNCMAFHPRYWNQSVKNSSDQYNYQRWNLESRYNAAQHVKADHRVQPRAVEEIEIDPQVKVLCKAGGVFLFSAAHLHSTVPNTSGVSRFSIDFRTVHHRDVLRRIGAANIDSQCTGTTMGDYLRGTDLSHLPQDAIALYEDGAELQFATSSSMRSDMKDAKSSA